MNNPIQGIVTVVGRLFLATIFLMSALGSKIPQFSNVAQMMEGQGVPAPKFMLAGAIAFLIAGSLSIIVGFKARIGATLLLFFFGTGNVFLSRLLDMATRRDVDAQHKFRSQNAGSANRNDLFHEKPGAHGSNAVHYGQRFGTDEPR